MGICDFLWKLEEIPWKSVQMFKIALKKSPFFLHRDIRSEGSDPLHIWYISSYIQFLMSKFLFFLNFLLFMIFSMIFQTWSRILHAIWTEFVNLKWDLWFLWKIGIKIVCQKKFETKTKNNSDDKANRIKAGKRMKEEKRSVE